MSDVINGVPRELLERALKADASIGANAIQLADGWKAMAELRALLTAQPQASAAQNQCGECGFPNGAKPHCGMKTRS